MSDFLLLLIFVYHLNCMSIYYSNKQENRDIFVIKMV